MVKVAVFGTKQWVKGSFEEHNKSTNHELVFYDANLSVLTVWLFANKCKILKSSFLLNYLMFVTGCPSDGI